MAEGAPACAYAADAGHRCLQERRLASPSGAHPCVHPGSIWPGISGICKGAVLLARFHVPLSFLYDLTGDAHALVLHLDTTPHLTGWMLPSYIHYDPEASASYLEQALGGQFISDDRREEA
jgi:hypothetical protein